jgi:hypothetical protein
MTSFTIGKPEPSLLPGEEHAINVVAETQLSLPESGAYVLELDIGGKPAARKVIPVAPVNKSGPGAEPNA